MSATADLLELGERIVRLGRELGADEVAARTGAGTWTELVCRDGAVEKAHESRSLSATISLLVDDRYSSHHTSDLRPEALRTFLRRAVEATRYLEPDPDRRLPELSSQGVSRAALDLLDPQPLGEAETRRSVTAQVEAAIRAAVSDLPIRSVSASASSGRSAGAMVHSQGFSAAWEGTRSTFYGGLSVEDVGGRLPDSHASFSAVHQSDLPPISRVGEEVGERIRRRLGSGPAPSGRYPLLLEGRVAARLLGVLTGPLDGTALFEKRSCMAGRLGQRVASAGFSLYDDPLLPRAIGSRACDGEGRPSARRAIVEDGVLQSYLLGVYNARRLGVAPTVASLSNVVVPAGRRSPEAILAELGPSVRVDGFLGGNTHPTSGDFSFGITGLLVDRGEETRRLSEMNVSGNVFELFDRFLEAAEDTWVYGTWQSPSLLFDDVQLSGT